MGFGLFVPEFRDDFALSTTLVGIVSSVGFFGFLLGLVFAQLLLLRRGPEAPVLTGLTCATLGIALVALAPNVWVLALGVCLAASSAGFDWTPFNDAVSRKVQAGWQPVALSGISSGTAIGIALAGTCALGMVLFGLSWRIVWAGFAVAAALVLIGNWAALRQVERAADTAIDWRTVLRRDAIPLYVVGFVFGIVSANYLSFAADHMRSRGGPPGLPVKAIPAAIFVTYGLFGLSGLLTESVTRRVGQTWLLRALMVSGAVSLALVVLAPGTWWGFVASAGLQGIHVMMVSAVLSFWCARIFPALPSLGFTAALVVTAIGSVLGPALGGIVSDSFGPAALFLGSAAFPALAALWLRAEHARPAKAQGTAHA
ncbi:YbfB/YjiJ family MFS transporter [Maribius pontilimi]|uniref:YbfB/YjiJ family MFS transporter n=2 Tax=Palleronia pontilimi TaxID=1964209 RepID=A0A934MDR4_9RHOB|nr:YbfB/YjiJ family MFS transporter [Palleronia pontilimi]